MNASSARDTGFDFERLYAADPDPWQFASSEYEREKYAATLAHLGRPHYAAAFEPGCAIGVLTAALAARCTRLLATDIAPSALVHARARCTAQPQVIFEAADFREFLGTPRFDLIVFSEVGYYFGADHLATIAVELVSSLLPGGELLAVHWLGHSADHALHGDEVHSILGATRGLQWGRGTRRPGYRLDQWRAE